MRDADRPSSARNVLGGPLAPCCEDPATGFFRDGYCHTGPQDVGSHTICASVTAEFLEFSRKHGNDLGTPRPEFMPVNDATQQKAAGDGPTVSPGSWKSRY